MKINQIPPPGAPQKKQSVMQRQDNAEKKIKSAQNDTYETGTVEKTLTYSRPKVDQAAIERLRAESEQTLNTLRMLVEKLLQKQGYSAGQSGIEIVVDEATRSEAARLIADDGPLGAEAVSDRIVQFAIAVSGGDKSKLAQLKGAIDEGFRQVKNILGILPEVSLRTYDLIMEKLDRWAEGE